MQNTGGNDFSLQQFEYCYLVEDTDPRAREMKIYIPKLMGQMSGGNKKVSKPIDKSSIINASDCDTGSASSVQSANYILAPVQLELAHRHKLHDCPGNCINLVHSAMTCHSGTSTLKPCPHFHHDHHFPHTTDGTGGVIPANTQLICMFMDQNPNNCIVTRIWCKFPDGTTNGTAVNEHRG